jgi:hypothetical protein
MPTGSDELSTDRWSAGPSVLLLTMPGKWVVGLLAQNVWDFAGSGDTDVNKLTLQPILNFNLGTGWYLTSTPVITSNWTAESGEEWTVPWGMGVGRLQKMVNCLSISSWSITTMWSSRPWGPIGALFWA